MRGGPIDVLKSWSAVPTSCIGPWRKLGAFCSLDDSRVVVPFGLQVAPAARRPIGSARGRRREPLPRPGLHLGAARTSTSQRPINSLRLSLLSHLPRWVVAIPAASQTLLNMASPPWMAGASQLLSTPSLPPTLRVSPGSKYSTQPPPTDAALPTTRKNSPSMLSTLPLINTRDSKQFRHRLGSTVGISS